MMDKILMLFILLSIVNSVLPVILVSKTIKKKENRKRLINIYKFFYFGEMLLLLMGFILINVVFIKFTYNTNYIFFYIISKSEKIAAYMSLTFMLSFSAPIISVVLKAAKRKYYLENWKMRIENYDAINDNTMLSAMYSLGNAMMNYIKSNFDKLPILGIIHIINLVLVVIANISEILQLNIGIKSTEIYMAIATFYAIQKIIDYFKKKYSNLWSALDEKFFMTKEIDKAIYFDLNDLKTVIDELFNNYIETGKYVLPEEIREKYFKWSVTDENAQHNSLEDAQEKAGEAIYYSDRPILTSEEDLLKRKYFAELMAKALVNLQNSDTFTIGLYGRWGNGKTSLVNMMLKEIEKNQVKQEELIVVHFEPWNFSNTDQLLEQFFVRLTNVFRNSKDEKMRKIGDALEKYSDAFEIAEVIPYVGGLLSLFGKKGSEALGKKLKKGIDEKDILKQKENVINLLSQQAKRVLIVIDDIDRLNNEQIRQVFQLITSVAKFPNTTYLLVFDKEIVVKALEKVQEGSGEEYLEKIIQMPIQIPEIHQNEFRKVLFDRLDRIIASFEGVMFEQAHWAKMFEPCVEPLINNLRDINRLCNSIQFKLSALATEVDFTDLVVISAIEIAYPSIYEWIKVNKSILTGEQDFSSYLTKDKPQKEQYEFYLNVLEKRLERENRKSKNEKETENVIEIIARLFPFFGKKIGKTMEMYDLDLFRKNNRIAHPEKFERYFNLNVEYIDLRTEEVTNAIYRMESDELSAYIIEKDKEEASYEFLQEIKATVDDITPNRAKTIITSIFKSASMLDMVTRKSLLSTSSKNYAVHLVLPLFEKIDPIERLAFWEKQIEDSDFNSLPAIAQVINMMELGYGRLAANGEESGYEKIIPLGELVLVEKIFSQRAKTLIETSSMFDFADYRMILYLMENFEEEYIMKRLDFELKSNINVLKYLNSFISAWIGSGVRYEVSKKYEERLSKERILEAIQEERLKKTLFELPEENQRLCAAFCLKEDGKVDYDGHVIQEDADELLREWRKEIQ